MGCKLHLFQKKSNSYKKRSKLTIFYKENCIRYRLKVHIFQEKCKYYEKNDWICTFREKRWNLYLVEVAHFLGIAHFPRKLQILWKPIGAAHFVKNGATRIRLKLHISCEKCNQVHIFWGKYRSSNNIKYIYRNMVAHFLVSQLHIFQKKHCNYDVMKSTTRHKNTKTHIGPRQHYSHEEVAL